MTGTSKHEMRMYPIQFAILLVFVSLAVSCATTFQPPQPFLHSTDASWNQWLDTVVNVDIADVRVVYLPLTDTFSGMKLAIAQSDEPVESLKVALHANEITRRQALWLLSEKYGLSMSVEQVPGQPPYVAISSE
jgi:hypothetical protein